MKKKDIIQLVKKLVKEDAYGSATLTTQGAPRTRAIAPAGEDPYTGRVEYPYTVGAKTKNGMMESQGTLSSDMLNYADQYHMELVDTMKGVSTHPDKRTGGFKIVFPHYNGPDYTGAMFGKDVSMKIEKSKAAAKAAALKTVSKFQDQIEDYEITDKSRGGVHGSIHLFIMPKTMDESPMFKTDVKQDMAPEGMAERIKSVFNKVNGAKDPVQTPEWHKNRFKSKYGISFPEELKGINKDQAIAMNKYANDMRINENKLSKLKNPKKADLDKDGKLSSYEKTRGANIEKNMKEDISDDISSAEDDVAAATQTKADAEVKVADARKQKADAEKGALEENEYGGDSFGSAGTDKRTGQVIGDILQLIKSTGVDPQDVMEEIGQAFGVSFEFGRAFEGKNDEDDEQDMADVKADIAGMMEGYIKERGDDNLMEHMDKYRKRATLMEGATEKLFKLFNMGKTDAEVRNHYLQMNVDMPESFISKLRSNWESLRKTKLDLTLADKEAEGFNQLATPSVDAPAVGMEAPMEEKQLASGLKEI